MEKKVLLASSQLYLFWTTGVYYLWELSKNYSVSLLVPSFFRADEKFIRVASKLRVQKIFYFPFELIEKPHFKHDELIRVLSEAIGETRPLHNFQFNQRYQFNRYAFMLCKTRLCHVLNYTYVNGLLSKIDLNVNRGDMRKLSATELAKGRGVPRAVVLSFLKARHILGKWLNEKVFPSLHFDEKERKMLKVPPVDRHLHYHSFEAESIGATNGALGRTCQILHPVEAVGEECNNFLYGGEEGDRVLLLPSRVGFGELESERKKIDSYIDVVNLIDEKLPRYEVLMKLHPRCITNPSVSRILAYLRDSCKKLRVLDPRDNSMPWIMLSRVIVGGVSTALWWASFIPGKRVISIDWKDRLISDQMASYPGIFCVKGTTGLKELLGSGELWQLSTSIAGQRKVELPSLLEVLATIEENQKQ